jgi:hypothetical protein
MGKVREAAGEYLARQERRVHPKGKFDNGGRWYPADEEMRDCCRGLRNPSIAYPYSYWNHCRSATHVAELYGVSRKELLAEVRELRVKEEK